MPTGNLPARVVSKSAMSIKTITPSPLPYQNRLGELMEFFDLSNLNQAVIPFAYDGTAWLSVTQEGSKIRTGSLNNEFAPWTMLLYVLRDMPDFLFEEQMGVTVDEFVYADKQRRLNHLLSRLADAEQNNRRRLDQDDVLFAASVWYILAGSSDWSNGREMQGSKFLNQFSGKKTGLAGISLSRHERLFDDISQRLDGAFFADLDPFVHAQRLMQEADGHYCNEDTLWLITPEPSDFDKGSKLVKSYMDIVAKRGAKLAIMLPESHLDAAEGLGITMEMMRDWDEIKTHPYGIDMYNIDFIPGYRLLSNLELK